MSHVWKVGIDLAPASRAHDAPGTARLVTQQALALFAMDVDWQWVPLVENAKNPLWQAAEPMRPEIVSGTRFWTRATFQVGRAWERRGCSVGFATAYFVPWRGLPVIANFFDSNLYEHGGTWITSGRRWNYYLNRSLFSYAVFRARRLITLSQYCRDVMARRFPSAAAKFVVAPCGITPPLPDSGLVPKWAAGLDRPFFLYVGVFSDNKNQRSLMQAWAQLQTSHADLPALLLIGSCPPDYHRAVIEPLCRSLPRPDECIHAANVSDEDLAWAYHHALAYVQPSIAEGFGMPVAEAMSYGLAVASSKTTSLPEVGGDAAIYFDPLNPSEMARRVEELWKDEPLRASVARRGMERSRQFSWDRNAAIIAREIEQVLTHETRR